MGLFAELKRRNVIRVAGVYIVSGWILVQVATALEESIGLPEWFDGLIVALLLIGLPVAIIFAWAFEMTPEGVVRTEAVPEGESITSETGRKLDVTLATAIVALVIVIIWQSSTVPEPASSEPVAAESAESDAPSDASVAVLPFTDMSPGGDQEYFSDGLSEEILNLLVRADAIDVVSRTSAFQFKNTTLGIPEIATELKVRHVVEGSVRKSGETVRVTAQLIDALTDRHLWSQTYDRPLTVENLFEIQDDVANSIFEALSAELGIVGELELRAKRTTEDVDAYALFLQARTLYQARRDLDVVDELLGRAVQMDPQFAEAWAHKAATQHLMFAYGDSDLPVEVLQERGLEFARKALSIDEGNATALAVIPFIQMDQVTQSNADIDWADIFTGYMRATDADPYNASAVLWRGIAYAWVGNLEAAIADWQRCRQLDPHYAPCLENLHWTLADTGRDDDAREVLLDSMNDGAAKIQYSNLPFLARTGNELVCKAATNDVRFLRAWRHHDELYAAFRFLGADHTELAESLAEFYAANPERDSEAMEPVLLALGYPAVVKSPVGFWSSSGRKIRQTDAFKTFVRNTGIYDYIRETGWPAGCRPVGDDDFECD